MSEKKVRPPFQTLFTAFDHLEDVADLNISATDRFRDGNESNRQAADLQKKIAQTLKSAIEEWSKDFDGTEKSSAGKDSSAQESSAGKDSSAQESSAGKDSSAQESSAGKDSSAQESSAGKDSSAQESSAGKDSSAQKEPSGLKRKAASGYRVYRDCRLAELEDAKMTDQEKEVAIEREWRNMSSSEKSPYEEEAKRIRLG